MLYKYILEVTIKMGNYTELNKTEKNNKRLHRTIKNKY